MNIALSNKSLALIVLVLLTAIIVTLFAIRAVAHINVLPLFNPRHMAAVTSHY